jgi:hypothetical protein
MILPTTDKKTSNSENPEGESTNALELKMPDLISKLSSCKIYVFEALNSSKCTMLRTQTKKNTKTVHTVNSQLEIRGKLDNAVTLGSKSAIVLSATPNKNSSQITTPAIATINMLLDKILGRIHGLPTQSTERELPEPSRIMFRTRISLCRPNYLSYSTQQNHVYL